MGTSPIRKTKKISANQALIHARTSRGWSQKYIAEQIGAERYYLSRWEHGITTPSPYYRQKLCELFGMSAQELGLLPSTQVREVEQQEPVSMAKKLSEAVIDAEEGTRLLWHVPFQRNPFFTGREDILADIHLQICPQHASMPHPVALSGLGGIGKTQVAIEYAYRYADHYTGVFWVRAENRDVFSTDLISLADTLKLPNTDKSDASSTLQAVQRWLREHPDWLLILDNIEDPMLTYDLLPTGHQGQLLLTTQLQATGTVAERLNLERLPESQATIFLLRRAKQVAPYTMLENVSEKMLTEAQEIIRELDGLPLAIDQAGAFIEETESTLADYLTLYRTRRIPLLSLLGKSENHPSSVRTTFSMAIEQVKRRSPVAVDILTFCAFLSPDAIPEEIFTEAAVKLGILNVDGGDGPLWFNEAMKELRRFSLIGRNPATKTLTIHRLVQAVLRESLDEQTQQKWIEQTIRLINFIFPDMEEQQKWTYAQRYLSQALHSIEFINRLNIILPEARNLLIQIGFYLKVAQQFTQAEQLFQLAKALTMQAVGNQHPDMAKCLLYSGKTFIAQGKEVEGLVDYEQALAIYKQLGLGQSLSAATILANLAAVKWSQGNYPEANTLIHQAFTIRQNLLGDTHIDTGNSLVIMGKISFSQGKYPEAEEQYFRCLQIYEQHLEEDHPYIIEVYNHLGILYSTQGKYAPGETHFQKALILTQRR